MARKVLGDDPFATKPGAKPSRPPKSAKPSKSPPATKTKTSVRVPPPEAPAETVAVAAAPPPSSDVTDAVTAESAARSEVIGEVTAEDRGHATEPDAAVEESAAPSGEPDAVTAGSTAPSGEPDAVTAGSTAPSGEPDAVTDLDAQLAALLAAAKADESLRARLVEAVASITAPSEPVVEAAPALAITESTPPEAEESDDAGAMMRSDFYLRRWGRIAMRDRSEAVDDFGLDPAYEARWRPVWDFLYDRWWRVEVEGIHHVPSEGAVALVANHGGAIPFDGVMLATALRREHPAQRQLRWLADDFVFHMPFAGAYVNRLGAVRACQENAERLIRKGNAVALFPEGIKGIGKLYKDRYRLQRFGRGGHIKLAIRTRAPIVPVTILGNEDTNPMLADSGWLSKLLGVPYVPITPTFPLLGPLGLMPLPAKWRIFFGEPIPVDHLPPEAADDELLVGRLNEKLRATIQDTLDRALRARQSIFKG